MRGLQLPSHGDVPLRVLALGAHSDDIEIGAGGTLLQLSAGRPIELVWAVATGDRRRHDETQGAATDFSSGQGCSVVFGELPESRLPGAWNDAKDWVHSLRGLIDPDVVFTHVQHDLHQDHRVLAELVLNAFRDNLVLGFEIPKWDGDLGTPNAYVGLNEGVAERKVELLYRHFESQAGKDWFDDRTFLGLMRLRGVESRAVSGYAEGFYVRKAVLDFM